MRRRGKKRSNLGWIIALILIVGGLSAGAVFIYTANEFEQTKPTIRMPKYNYWNARDPLQITLEDNYGLKSYHITLSDGKSVVTMAQADNLDNIKKRTLLIHYPKGKLNKKVKKLTLKVVLRDKSKWNYLMGNSTQKIINLTLDYRRPNINILANSYSITQGGSALVIFHASDDDALAQLYVETQKKRFEVQPYKKSGYFISLIAWPFTEENFTAKVVVKDKAGNSRFAEIPFYLKNRQYRTSTIKASEKFINGKISDLAEQDSKYMKDDRLERLKAVNETMRIDNEKLIERYTTPLSTELLKSWKIKKFYPLRNGKKVANFGDHRYYYYKTKEHIISESYHLGYDMASTKMADIVSSNDGKVVFASDNGIYGNMPIIDHGLGLYTLYGHCSTIKVKEGDSIKAGETIAKTGMTGLALGDHLHFGIVVQGIEVRPIEWLDKKWIQDNINKIFKDADEIIDGPHDSNSTNSGESKRTAL